MSGGSVAPDGGPPYNSIQDGSRLAYDWRRQSARDSAADPGQEAMTQNEREKRFSLQVPEGDTQERHVCDHCGFIRYENPKVVTGSVVVHDGRVLLCRRAIPPRIGYWTLPAGYMELHETAEESACREAFEEACAAIEIETLLAVYSISRLSQVQVIYRARLIDSDIRPGPESREVGLFGWDDIPWDDLAFPSVRWALTQHRTVQHLDVFAPFANPEGETSDLT